MRISILSIAVMAFLGATLALPVAAIANVNPGPSCTIISRNLSIGSQGSDVSSLQRFLVAQNYPGGGSWMITGYYGLATQVAVRNFQISAGLSQTGTADPTTRAAIESVSCGTTFTGSNLFSNFFTNPYTDGVFLGAATGPTYNPFSPSCTFFNCGGQSIGISSLSQNSGAPGDEITVYGVGFTETNNTVHFGTGIIPFVRSNGTVLSFEVPSSLTGFGNDTLQLQTYNIYVTNSRGENSNRLPFSVTSGAGFGNQPSVFGVSGPNTLDLSESGTWRMNVFGPANSLVTIDVIWGDEHQQQSFDATKQSKFLDSNGTRTFSFSHTYRRNGVYSPTFVVSNSYGANSASATVVVGDGINTDGLSLSTLSPASGRVGSQVTLFGSGFTSFDNVVHFGVGGQRNVPSVSNGSAIYFTIPSSISPCDVILGTCNVGSVVVGPGTYPIFVTNSKGTTQTLTYTVTN